jgi:DNA-binding transcriptional LysR family regulator
MNSVKLAPLLLIFVEVANKRSFTEAAKKLGMSKSAISQQIKRLEQATGQQLLARNTRGVTLTAVGETLLARSEFLSQQLNLTLTELDSAKEQPSGQFKVSVPPFFEQHIVIPALQQLCVEFPKLIPEIIVTGKWQDLREHSLDVAIFGGDLKDSNYRALSIGKVAEIFCASPRYLKQHGNLTSLEQLTVHRFIATPWQHDELRLFDNKQNNEQRLKIAHYAKTNTLNTVLEMVQHGMGVALFPAFLATSELAQESIIRVLPELQGRAWQFYLLHQYQGEKPIHIGRFHQLISHYFNKANS